jgi:hypothetical protein
MVCTRVIDLGTQVTEFQGETKRQRKVLLAWEIPDQRIKSDAGNLPVLHSAKYTWSFHDGANLRRDLESWRGRKFIEDDFKGPPNGFHIKNLLGVPCLAQIVHKTGSNGKTYANISAIMAFPGKREAWPKPEGALMFFDLDNYDATIFGQLSEYWQGVIKNSPEWQAQFLQSPDHYGNDGYGHGPDDNVSRRDTYRGDLDDEIPF